MACLYAGTSVLLSFLRQLLALRRSTWPSTISLGTPEHMTAELLVGQFERDYDEALCQPYDAGMRHADALHAIELLGSAVLPQLQKEGISLWHRRTDTATRR